MRRYLKIVAAVGLAVGVSFVATQTAIADPSVGMVLHLPFDDGVNPTADTSGNANDGTLNGGTTFLGGAGIAPFLGNIDALDFAGGVAGGVATDFVEVTDNATLDIPGSLTVAAWVNLDRFLSTALVVIKERLAAPAQLNYALGVRPPSGNPSARAVPTVSESNLSFSL